MLMQQAAGQGMLGPYHIPAMPTSQPLITCPVPSVNSKGVPLSTLESNTLPSVREPCSGMHAKPQGHRL